MKLTIYLCMAMKSHSGFAISALPTGILRSSRYKMVAYTVYTILGGYLCKKVVPLQQGLPTVSAVATFASFGTHIRKRCRWLTALNGLTAFRVAYHLHPPV